MGEGGIAVLVNPRAGRGRHRGLLPGVLEALGRSGRPVRVLTADDGAGAEDACRQAVAEGVGAIVSVGGDGTVHRALQAVAGSEVPLGVVPAGTGNDFASAVGVPGEGLAAAEAISRALRDGRDGRVDLAKVVTCDGTVRWFGAVLAAGFDAIVNERANAMRWPRGPRRYDLAIALELARLRTRRYDLVLDGVEHSFDGVLVAIGNGHSYGGGMRICPAADPRDGMLDVVIGGDLGRAALTRLKPRLRRGTHVGDPEVTAFRAREVRVGAEGIVGYADGERVAALPLTVSCEKGAVRLLI
ncbi:diacylglycerol kinase family protein [Winogradskya humida]|uniref:Diacylglycerol kinase n=1 Tax=Winogradskya humida TaxID=113566 RepID=A0ABQ3ZUR6_9ACTN|nr:diacylglycerol kinase family protein [Actinoplanes humidus]GIE22316.1 diacylglycerol kinase [Actinoplanes humidus]